MTIGNEPVTETLVLVQGQDFLHEILPPVGETIPAGSSLDLKFYAPDDTVLATWAATVSAAAASWSVSSVMADTISIPARFRIYIRYSDGADLCWFQGAVTRP